MLGVCVVGYDLFVGGVVVEYVVEYFVVVWFYFGED